MSLLSRWHAWRDRRRWPLSSMVEQLRITLNADGRWLASDPVADALTLRYLRMTAPDWFRQPREDISTLRIRLGLDPHARHREPNPAGTLTREQVDQMSLDSTRFHWLTEDHADQVTRARRNEILRRMVVMSYSAVCADIDFAIHESMEREAIEGRAS